MLQDIFGHNFDFFSHYFCNSEFIYFFLELWETFQNCEIKESQKILIMRCKLGIRIRIRIVEKNIRIVR